MKGTVHVTKKGHEQLAKMKKVKKNKERELTNVGPDLETRLLRLENATSIGEALIYKTKKLEEQVKTLQLMFDTMLKMARPVSQPRYRSSEWHLRSGNVYQDVALPGSPNGQETKTAPAGETPDDQRGDLPSLK